MLADQSFVVPPLPTIVFNRGASQQLSNQIQALGKFGYYKSKIKGYLSSLTKSNFLSKFDFMH